ncbi:Proteinase inhibitor I25, cystatin [Cynara cardunculus var. scolymus]|uniref:Proteinase inhibitor I25, cystatin n=1 Tax=Cynara cardunculus var. scolymus TaxID=59895 RepID=A0A103XT10_CYNCS|nr:Proteinase inhibitor I25, cystatin [Cynara cardunculus var. scolymus]
MATHTRILLILLGFLFCFLYLDVSIAFQGTAIDSNIRSTDPYNQILDGDILPLDPNNPEVAAAVKFAVDKHNDDKKQLLVFVKVVRAESRAIT